MKTYVTFGADGFVSGSYPEDVFPAEGETRNAAIPADAIEIEAEPWADLMANQGLRKWDAVSAAIVHFAPPVPAIVLRVAKVDIWRRATDAEAVQLVALLGAQPVRLQRMFSDATVISSADDFWPMLSGAIADLLGAARAAELLAPSA